MTKPTNPADRLKALHNSACVLVTTAEDVWRALEPAKGLPLLSTPRYLVRHALRVFIRLRDELEKELVKHQN